MRKFDNNFFFTFSLDFLKISPNVKMVVLNINAMNWYVTLILGSE